MSPRGFFFTDDVALFSLLLHPNSGLFTLFPFLGTDRKVLVVNVSEKCFFICSHFTTTRVQVYIARVEERRRHE